MGGVLQGRPLLPANLAVDREDGLCEAAEVVHGLGANRQASGHGGRIGGKCERGRARPGLVRQQLLDGEPRIMTHAGLNEGNQDSEMLLRPVAMWTDEYKVVANRIHEILSKAPGPKPKPKYAPPVGNIAGLWESTIQFKAGTTRHTFYLDLKTNMLRGQYTGRLVKGPLKGHVDGNQVEFSSSGRLEGTSLSYTYKGTFNGDTMSGTVDLGEYGPATFSATRKA